MIPDPSAVARCWYFDAHLADGAKLVVTFMNKDIAEPRKPLSPLLRLDLDLPDGRHFEKLVHYAPGAWSAAKEHADVRLGENRFTGDLHRYRIQASAEEISVDVTLTGAMSRRTDRGSERVETRTDDAIWELRYFCHARDQ